MSATSVSSPTSPLQQRDIRSSNQEYKRAKDQGVKWAMGARAAYGKRIPVPTLEDGELLVPDEILTGKVRPQKKWSNSNTDPKSRANVSKLSGSGHTAPTYAAGRIFRTVDARNDAMEDASAPLSRSLLELIPQHANNTSSSIHTALRENADAGVLYSFDKKVSPGKTVELGSLIERAEKKWEFEMTEKIVKGEYEVLDDQGESVVIGKGRGKKSPKSKAKVEKRVDEDEDFELL
ncbi:hypothetical protein B7494_g8611 [Chlorociboria aeruginascens]|nr:hypothetical protein B7494_g8611 [Chlorociboria aeruginascens]